MKKHFGRLAILSLLLLLASYRPVRHEDPLVSIGGGYFFGGPRHSGGLLQLEYKWDCCFFNHFRPQATLFFPELKGLFAGIGVGLECYFSKNLLFIPSFEPGFYYKGRSRNLGFPIEFRSSLELAYENDYGFRLGCQFFHVSNACLGNHNPGANAFTVYLAMPLFYLAK